MVSRTVSTQKRFAAYGHSLGTDNGSPKSGYFSMHFTYPDTGYEDDTATTWAAGGGQQGFHLLIRTPQAGDTTNITPADGTNFVVVDLKRAAQANIQARATTATFPLLTYDLGTEEATRMIASAINSSRDHQVGLHGRNRYLKARYVKMSGAKTYKGTVYGISNQGTSDWTYPLTAHPFVRLEMGDAALLAITGSDGGGTCRITEPSDIPKKGVLHYLVGGGTRVLEYDGYKIVGQTNLSAVYYIDFNITSDSAGSGDIAENEPILIRNEVEEQHTVVVSWEGDVPSNGGYWGSANGGPIVQGLGSELPTWFLTAKPMDGGNMGLPALNHETRGGKPIKDKANGSNFTLNRGFSRFSIEGLNSCSIQPMPPPDMVFDGPSVMGQVAPEASNRYTDSTKLMPVEGVEHGTDMDSMGPYPSGCFVTTDKGASITTHTTFSGGVEPASSTTTVKVTTPDTDFNLNFQNGSAIYNSSKEIIGTVSAHSALQQLTPNGSTHDTGANNHGIRSNGPRLRSSGLAYTRNGSAVRYGAGFVEVTSGNPSTTLVLGDYLYYSDDAPIGEVASTQYVFAMKAQFGSPLAFTSTPHLGVKLQCIGDSGGSGVFSNFATDGILLMNDNPFGYLVVGEEFVYHNGSAFVATGKTISEMNAADKTVKIDISGGAPAILGSTFDIGGKALSAKAIRFATIGASFLGQTGGPLLGGEHVLFCRRKNDALRPSSGLFGGAGATFSDYTQADFDVGQKLLFVDANSAAPHNVRVNNAETTQNFADGTTAADNSFAKSISIHGFEAMGTGATAAQELFGYASSNTQWFGRSIYGHDGVFYGDGIMTKDGFLFANFAGTTIPAGELLARTATTITLTANNAKQLANGEELYFASTDNKWDVAYENGMRGNVKFGAYQPNEIYDTASGGAPVSHLAQITDIDNGTTDLNNALAQYANAGSHADVTTSPRAYRTVRNYNQERVQGLLISNEERVYDNIAVVDDNGNKLTLEGGSPFGTVIKDYTIPTGRIDPETGLETASPAYAGSGLEANLKISLPNPEEIPGNIMVTSGHDRVQAWKNMTWGMGGLTEPNLQKNGVVEQNLDSTRDDKPGEATQFDTHDRVLHFHPVRILHDTLQSQFGLNLNNQVGSVPSGTTRLFAAHRLSDHAERGSVLFETVNGVASISQLPHNRIRFGRQGHSFVTPLTHRGTPKSLRRQLHRSHGSAYSLMFEAETEYKHWGFQNGEPTHQNATNYFMDTLETKIAGYGYSAGSFSSDGFPCTENAYGATAWHEEGGAGANPLNTPEILFAPGQEHTMTEGSYEQSLFVAKHGTTYAPSILGKADVVPYATVAHSGPVAFVTEGTKIVNNRFNAGEEFALNGFYISQYKLMGGRPLPTEYLGTVTSSHTYVTVRGMPQGWIQARAGTELATVPPLIAHDAELTNKAGVPIPIHGADITSQGHLSIPTTDGGFRDFALAQAGDTNSGVTPDAFLCTWLAEYNHPALFGTVREQYMTMRYRSAGMPSAMDKPQSKDLLLRNADISNTISNPSLYNPQKAMPFERLYAFQWLQQYGYNALNAGGHGDTHGIRAAGAVLMGHTTIREAHGTLRLPTEFDNERLSRGEGIGDGLTPVKSTKTSILHKHPSSGRIYERAITVTNPMSALDFSRRLPVRAWGMKGASDALNMLSGDPSQSTANNTAQQAITRSARFDGGVHDSMQKLPTIADGADWIWPRGYSGVERTTPIGVVMTSHTSQGLEGEGFVRLSNEPWIKGEKEYGMGRVLQDESMGLVSRKAMPAGLVESVRTTMGTDVGTSIDILTSKTLNTGSDPIIGLNHHSGDSVKAAGSVSALTQTEAFGASTSSNFIHQKGNNLHINAHPVDYFTGTTLPSSTDTNFIHDDKQHHFPANGWGREIGMKDTTLGTVRGIFPIPLSEISDHRQVQSDMSPRLGVVADTHSTLGENKDYIVTSTKAVSLHSDLAVGQQFPVTPSYVQHYGKTKDGQTLVAGTVLTTAYGTTGGAHPYGRTATNLPHNKPTWGMTIKNNNGALTNSDSTKMIGSMASVKDHWAVRGSADLPPWGGVFILRKTWLDREENKDIQTSSVTHQAAGGLGGERGQALRKSVDYVVRMVRPLKVFSFAGAIQPSSVSASDGWLLGPKTEINLPQLYHRDNRYGIFELNEERGTSVGALGSPYSSTPVIDWPDANNRSVVWHLIPSANMLQHFKSDASRTDNEGNIHAEIDARYSQTTHPGGGEEVSQSEQSYVLSESVINEPFMMKDKDSVSVKKQTATALTVLGVKSTIVKSAPQPPLSATGGYIQVGDTSGFPASGTLIVIGKSGQFTYATKDRNTFYLNPTAPPATGDLAIDSDLVGMEIRPGKNLGTGLSIYAGANVASGSTSQLTLNTDWSTGSSTPSVGQLPPREAFSIGEKLHTTNGVIGTVLSFIGPYTVVFTNAISIAVAQNDIVRGTNTSYNSTKNNIQTVPQRLVIAPSFVDNAVTMGAYLTDKFDGTDKTDTQTFNTPLSYRGIGHYDPSDFSMLTPQRFALSDGESKGSLSYISKPGTGGLPEVVVDGNKISSATIAPYLLDGDNKRWRIAGKDKENGLSFKNLQQPSLSKSGMQISNGKHVKLGHPMSIGIRTTDAALMLLEDLTHNISGADLVNYETYKEQLHNLELGLTTVTSQPVGSTTLLSLLGGHPALHYFMQHSNTFVNRTGKGLFVMDLIKHFSQMDGHQLVIGKGGVLLYTEEAFSQSDRRVGSSSAPQLVEKSAMMERANHIIVHGDRVAENETVKAEVKDMEHIKKMGGKGGEGLERTLIQVLPGLKNKAQGLRLAKSMMRRTEQGASILRVEGLAKAQDIEPGDIIGVDFAMEGITGEFAVFETYHDFNTGLSNLVIGQYEKGIEGLIADLQTASGENSESDATSLTELFEMILSSSIKVVASSRVMIRMNNNTSMAIGGGWRSTENTNLKVPLGGIGVSGGRTGILSATDHAAGSTATLSVDTLDARSRVRVGDSIEVKVSATTSSGASTDYDQWLHVGVVGSVGLSTIGLNANNAVLVPNNTELRVIHKRGQPIGQSKSVFYGVK